MRKINAVLSALVMIMLFVHSILGTMNMLGADSANNKTIAYITLVLASLHAVIGIILTIQTLRTIHKSGAAYFRNNLLFWARRISGFLVMILIIFHMSALMTSSDNGLRLPVFDEFRLITQILFVLSLTLHVISNVKPVLISFGIKNLRPKAGDIIFWCSILLLAATIGFIVYYIRWMAV